MRGAAHSLPTERQAHRKALRRERQERKREVDLADQWLDENESFNRILVSHQLASRQVTSGERAMLKGFLDHYVKGRRALKIQITDTPPIIQRFPICESMLDRLSGAKGTHSLTRLHLLSLLDDHVAALHIHLSYQEAQKSTQPSSEKRGGLVHGTSIDLTDEDDAGGAGEAAPSFTEIDRQVADASIKMETPAEGAGNS